MMGRGGGGRGRDRSRGGGSGGGSRRSVNRADGSVGYVPGYDGVDMSFGFPPYEDPPPPYALYKPEDMLPPHEPPPPYTEINDGFEPDNNIEGGWRRRRRRGRRKGKEE